MMKFSGQFIVLGVRYVWKNPPLHALQIPLDFQEKWDDDFRLTAEDFVDRASALKSVGEENRKYVNAWCCAFEIGEIAPSSFVNIGGGTGATFTLDTYVMIVRPTAEEIAKYGKLSAAKPKKKRKAA